MRWLIFVAALFAVITPVCAADVHIFMDKKSVNLGDQIRFQVYFDVNRSADIALVGEGGDGVLLCHLDEGEEIYEKCGEEWVFKIPEDWQEGKYLLKVVIDDITPEVHSEEFVVVKPKIKEIEVPRLVYQGEYEVKVYAETANGSATRVMLSLYGKNEELYYEEYADFKEGENLYSADFKINLAEAYERTRDIADALEPGEYILEAQLEYGGKVWDLRRMSVSIEEPKLDATVPETVKAGEPVVVSIKTNRDGDVEYDGIIVVLSGNNFLIYKKAYLDENGDAKVQFETAGLVKGKYRICLRDTSRTSSISMSDLAKNYCDLSPDNSYAKIIQAQDDVLVLKNFWIIGDRKEPLKVYLRPSNVEMVEGESLKLNVSLEKAQSINSFEFVVLSSGDSVRFESVLVPKEFEILERTVHPDYVKVIAFSKDGVSTGKLAEVKVVAEKQGEAWLRLKNVRLVGEDSALDVTPVDAHILVKENRAEGVANFNISASETGENNTTSMDVNTKASETTTPAPTITETATATPAVTQNLAQSEEIDFRKVAMFTAGFLATYTAGKIVRRRFTSGQGKH